MDWMELHGRIQLLPALKNETAEVSRKIEDAEKMRTVFSNAYDNASKQAERIQKPGNAVLLRLRGRYDETLREGLRKETAARDEYNKCISEIAALNNLKKAIMSKELLLTKEEDLFNAEFEKRRMEATTEQTPESEEIKSLEKERNELIFQTTELKKIRYDISEIKQAAKKAADILSRMKTAAIRDNVHNSAGSGVSSHAPTGNANHEFRIISTRMKRVKKRLGELMGNNLPDIQVSPDMKTGFNGAFWDSLSDYETDTGVVEDIADIAESVGIEINLEDYYTDISSINESEMGTKGFLRDIEKLSESLSENLKNSNSTLEQIKQREIELLMLSGV